MTYGTARNAIALAMLVAALGMATIKTGPRAQPAESPVTAAPATGQTDETCKQGFVVVLDVGHDERRPGAVSARGRPEYQFNLALARRTQQALLARGFRRIELLIMEPGSSLKQRVKRANDLQPNLLVSIHHDSVQPVYLLPWLFEGRALVYSDRFSGYSLFISRINQFAGESLRFADELADQLLERGLHSSLHHSEDIPGERHPLLDPRRGIYAYDDLAVLRGTRAPAALLEAGLIVNREEEVTLSENERRRSVAESLADAILKFCAGVTRSQ
jgi:N-acetylmuramoyl-L-alanine amidase